ncbi:MAG TPA: acylphosphatase [Jatrophihabitantaceae bacterium]
MADVRLTVWVEGTVQGVWFRWWTRRYAIELGLTGSATNLADGRVEVVADGKRAACQALLDLLQGPHTPGDVRAVTYEWGDADGRSVGFTVR